MGEFTTFRCESCGYVAARIRWGAGQADARVRFLPAVCQNCRKIIEVELTGRDIITDEFTCSECGHPVFFFEKADSYRCPVCGQDGVRLSHEGYW